LGRCVERIIMAFGDPGRRVFGRAAAFAVAVLLSGRTHAQTPTPEPTPSPAPKRLRLDIDGQVKKLLEEEQRKDIPRFETQVEVIGTSPQVMLDRFLKGIEHDCRPGGAPPGGGAPTHIEMRQARWHPGPSADFQAALLKLLGDAFKGKMRGQDRYFLYRVTANGEVSYLLREGRVPDALLYARPATTYELISAYADTKSGAKGLRRMQRGFGTPEGSSAPPPADWQTSTCPPR
jgi:hypothetical protein